MGTVRPPVTFPYIYALDVEVLCDYVMIMMKKRFMTSFFFFKHRELNFCNTQIKS